MGNDPEVILIVGEKPSSDPLARDLVLDGYRVLRAPRLLRLCRALAEPDEIDLIILSPAPQQASRLHPVRALRAGELDPEINSGVRVLWASASDEVAEVLRAFEAGADDVIRSPFLHAELLARVRALLRRGILSSAGVIQFGALRIDTNAHAATFASTPVHLRRLGYQGAGSTRTVDTHACRLRRTLVDAGASGWLIAVRGVGYRLSPDGHGELRLLAGRRSA